ncbi:DUF4416 family protein [Neorhodopirellula pilleata]|uniref:GTP-binding protein n=1 Tax=Neorhodopirellula pilleata TaxID=2714738 RepID=A0A5C6A4Z8_9BACT|nr:DUF4416 family protein [Neorhodopirellula pilleata]TWT94994.1 hypothetical protein Pla100_35730 [Neorhodopirellula pilleata]
MSELRLVEPVVRTCAIISRHAGAHRWAIERLARTWGPIVESTAPSIFPASFYQETMGDGLTKVLVAMEPLSDPGELADWKTSTNAWEAEYAAVSDHSDSRPVNLDPGYVSQAKLVLATIKDRDHRIYLRDGIFAEVTLNYMKGRWVHHRWTYPDYRTDEVADFAMRCRNRLRNHLQSTGQFRRG